MSWQSAAPRVSRRVVLAQLGAAGAAVGLAACSAGSSAAPPPLAAGSPTPAGAAAPTPSASQLTIGFVSVSASNAPTFSAVDGGYFAEQGLDVSVVAIGTSPQAAASMLSGELPLNTGITATQMVAANRKGGGTLLLASSVNTFPYSILTQSTIKTVEDLKVKKFGISQFGSSADTASRLYLRRNNLDPDNEVTLIQTGGLPQTLAAMQANGIDAGLLTPPVDQQGLQAGFVLLADLGSLGIEYCANGVATTKDYLDKNHDRLVAVLKAIVQGVHRFKTDQSFGEGVISKWTNVDDPAIVTASWKPYATKYLQNKLYVTDAGIQTVLGELSASDSTAQSADPKSFYDNSLLQSLDATGFFASLGIAAEAR